MNVEDDNAHWLFRSIARRYPHVRGMAIFWCKAEDYARLRAVSADQENLPETFEAWEAKVTARFDALVAAGHPLEKVIVDIDRLIAFCRAYNLPVDVRTRSMVAVFTLNEQRVGHA